MDVLYYVAYSYLRKNVCVGGCLKRCLEALCTWVGLIDNDLSCKAILVNFSL